MVRGVCVVVVCGGVWGRRVGGLGGVGSLGSVELLARKQLVAAAAAAAGWRRGKADWAG